MESVAPTTDGHIKSQLHSLLQEFSFFRNLEAKIQERLPSLFSFGRAEAGTVLFYEGDAPRLCYIILSGEVTIWKSQRKDDLSPRSMKEKYSRANSSKVPPDAKDGPSEDAPEDEEEEEETLGTASREAMAMCALLAAVEGMPDLPDCRETAQEEQHGMALATLGPGRLLGELAIVDDRTRMATAVCQTACKFLTMERTDFLNCQCALIDDLDDRLTFLRLAAPPLRSLSKEAEHAALYCFEEQNFALNHVFFQEGGAGDGSIYFIRSGAVELLCREPGTHKAVPRAGLHRMCLLQEGACFASSFTKVEEEFTAAVASTPCKVYRIRRAKMRHLPYSFRQNFESFVEKVMSSRLHLCKGVPPEHPLVTAILDPPKKRAQPPSSVLEKTSRPLLGKMRSLKVQSLPDLHGKSASGRAKKKDCLQARAFLPLVELHHRETDLRPAEVKTRGMLNAGDMHELWRCVELSYAPPAGMWPRRRLAYCLTTRPDFQEAKWRQVAQTCATPFAPIPHESVELVTFVLDKFVAM
eukprot:s171_g6.t1